MCIVRSAAWQEGRYDIDLHRDGQSFKFTTLLKLLSLSLGALSMANQFTAPVNAAHQLVRHACAIPCTSLGTTPRTTPPSPALR